MDFFEHQAKARKKSTVLYALFALLVLVFCTVLSLSYSYIFNGHLCANSVNLANLNTLKEACAGSIDWSRFVVFFLINLVIIIGASTYKVLQLSKGGLAVVESLDGEIVHSLSKKFHHKRLLNIVEEMSLASGSPVPTVFEISSASINAFVAGTKPANTVLAVTTGAIQCLSRDELQAVVAHEFSHIFNKDMKLNMDVIGVSYGLLFFFQVGYHMLRSTGRARSSKQTAVVPILGFVFLAVGGLGYLFSLVLKMALSRQREFLADALSAQYTRNPESLATALKKISIQGSQIKQGGVTSISHMCFANSCSLIFNRMTRTHPPVEQRIRRLGFDPRKLTVTTEDNPLLKGGRKIAISKNFGLGHVKSLVGGIAPFLLDQQLRDDTHDAYRARALLLSLMLQQDENLYKQKLEIITIGLGQEIADISAEYMEAKGTIIRDARLDLIDMVIPCLRQLTKEQLIDFMKCMKKIIYVDKKIDHFEYTIYTILKNNLQDLLGLKDIVRSKKFAPYELEAILASAVAATTSVSHKARDTYHSALKEMQVPLIRRVEARSWDALEYELALDSLSKQSDSYQKKIVNSLVRIAKKDGLIETREHEVLRSVFERLSLPLMYAKGLVGS